MEHGYGEGGGVTLGDENEQHVSGHRHHIRVSTAAITGHLTRLGLIEPQDKKRRHASYTCLQAAVVGVS